MKVTKYTYSIDDTSLEELLKQVKELEAKGASDFCIDTEPHEYRDGGYPVLSYKIEETKEEEKYRLEQEKKTAAYTLEHKRRAYEQLKKEFEGK